MADVEKVRIVFLDRATLAPEIVLRDLSFPHEFTFFGRTAPGEVAERIADAHLVITNKVPVRAAAIDGAKSLKLIAVAATGTDIVDIGACNARGVTVANVRNYALHTVPEHTFALILALRRSIIAYRDSVVRGRWQQAEQFCFFDHPIRDLAGSTLGIIGRGTLGKSVADIAKGFQMRVLFSARKGGNADALHAPFHEVLEQSDIITLHVPLTPSTRNMIGAEEFRLMKRAPLLINTARGGLVDEVALGDALRSGQIAGAGFDVASAEPPSDDHPLMQLLSLPNFLLTPHVAWASREAMQSLADKLVENIEAFHGGHPINVVT